jgi:hypothetical protein
MNVSPRCEGLRLYKQCEAARDRCDAARYFLAQAEAELRAANEVLKEHEGTRES